MELYLTTPMTTAQVVECLGLSDQTVPGTLAGDGSPVCWPYGQTHNSSGDKTEGDRTGAGRHAAEAGRQTAWRERWCGAQLGQGVPQGAAWPRCSPGTRMPPRAGNRRPSVLGAGRMPGGGDDVEALRRRVEELELENALMREVVEARRKRPRRRPAAPVEQGEDDAGRPAEAEVFAEVDGLLAAHSAEQLPLPPCQDRR